MQNGFYVFQNHCSVYRKRTEICIDMGTGTLLYLTSPNDVGQIESTEQY